MAGYIGRSAAVVRAPGSASLVAVLRQIDTWQAGLAACSVLGPQGVIASYGPTTDVVRIASVSKPLLAYAVLLACEEGVLSLDQPAGPAGATIRHLLAHAGGYGFDGTTPIAPVEARRIYSNTGFDEVGRVLAQATGFSVVRYLQEGVFEPLGMKSASLRGSPAKDVWASVEDLEQFAVELLRPTLLAPSTVEAMRTIQFPTLSGVVPEVGRFAPNPWGLGVEIRGDKQPHWTGTTNSPLTFGHFGGSGTFLWVDPTLDLAVVCLTDRVFGPWAMTAWPALSDEIIAARPGDRGRQASSQKD